MDKKTVGGREVLLEFWQVGGYVRVAAIDVETNTEVTIVGAASVSEAELTRVAVRKLEYVLGKERPGESKKQGRRRRGIEV